MRRTILFISILTILVNSSLSLAFDSYLSVNNAIETDSITEPSNLVFSETGDELKGNVSTRGNVKVFDSFDNQIGSSTADEYGDFSVVLEPYVSSGNIIYIVANKSSQIASVSIIVPEHIGQKDIVKKQLKK